MSKCIPLLLLLILGLLDCVFADSAIEKAVALSHELELRFDCTPGSMIYDVSRFDYSKLVRPVCGGYLNLILSSFGSDWMDYMCSVGLDGVDGENEDHVDEVLDLFYSKDVDDRVDTQREDARRFKDDCNAPAKLEETISPANTKNWWLSGKRQGCAKTEYKCSNRATTFDQYDEDCIRGTLQKAQKLRKQINPNPPIGAQCRDLSNNIEKRLHEAYMAIHFTERIVINQLDQSDTALVQFEKSAAATQHYEELCVEAEGTFRQIDFRAMCLAWWCDDPDRCFFAPNHSKNTTLVVSAQPRCYSVDCEPEDDEGLLREQTLRLTELKLKDSLPDDDDTRVMCFGHLVGQGQQEELSICLEHSKAIGEDRLIRARTEVEDMQPVVQPAKNKFLFWELNAKEESTVTFPNAAKQTVAFEEVCVSKNGTYTTVEDFTLRCEERSTSKLRKSEVIVEQVWKYRVSGFPTCLSPLCYGDSSSTGKSGAENALLLKRISHLQKSKKSGSNWVCDRSSAVALAFSTTVLSLATLMVTTWGFL